MDTHFILRFASIVLLVPGVTPAAELADGPQQAPPSATPATAAVGARKPDLHPKAPAPVSNVEIKAAIERGAEFLLKDQNVDGSWGSPERTKDLNIIAGIGSHHAFRAAVTALCVSALIEISGPRSMLSDPSVIHRAPSNMAKSSCFANCRWSAATARCSSTTFGPTLTASRRWFVCTAACLATTPGGPESRS